MSQPLHKLHRLFVASVVLVALSIASTALAPAANAQRLPDEIINALTISAPRAQPTPVRTPVPTPAPRPAPAAVLTGSRAGFPADVAALLPASVFNWLDASGWQVQWLQGPGPGRQAEARYSTRTVVIWRTADRPTSFWAGALGHELGHAVSFTHLSSPQKQQWNELRGVRTWSWVPGTPNDFSVGEGDFAEAFMSYILGHSVRSVGGPLSSSDRAFIAANTPF